MSRMSPPISRSLYTLKCRNIALFVSIYGFLAFETLQWYHSGVGSINGADFLTCFSNPPVAATFWTIYISISYSAYVRYSELNSSLHGLNCYEVEINYSRLVTSSF